MSKVNLAYDFRSDTVTQPCAAMKEAMMNADLGDDVYREDPSALALEEKTASLLGKEAALYFPTGCMANLTALMMHAQPGSVLYAGARSHIKLYELGSYARIAGLSLVEVPDTGGRLDFEALKKSWFGDIYYLPKAGVICVENTHNMLGGLVYPEQELARVAEFAREKQTPLHMDGARLFNAAVAKDCSPTVWTQHVDSVMVALSKGLGAPMGSILAGRKSEIDRALAIRKMLGGGMRQVGMTAAAALYALDHNLPLLARDHDRCRRVYEAAKEVPGLDPVAPDTNILIINMAEPKAQELVAAADAVGAKVMAVSDSVVRAVFHLNISDEACEALVDAFRKWGQR